MSFANEKARALIEKYGTRDPERLAEHLGITVIDWPFHPNVKGLALRISGMKYIGINRSLDGPERKAVLAHELGHAVLHSRWGYYFQVEHTFFPYGKAERQANEFAAELLLGDEQPKTGESMAEFAARKNYPVNLVGFWFGRIA